MARPDRWSKKDLREEDAEEGLDVAREVVNRQFLDQRSPPLFWPHSQYTHTHTHTHIYIYICMYIRLSIESFLISVHPP